jgi:beta-N-acetylhexosaminidase
LSDLRQRIGQLLCVGIPGTELDQETRRRLEDLHAGGVILFRRNVGTPDQILALTTALHALPSQPLVAIDHEGGRVMRLGEPFTQFPAAATIGHAGDAALAYQVGRAMAAELASVGIDINFAPVLDVHSNPANPVIGDRAFGTDPARVAQMGVALMRGLRDGGVIPCGKHFPGHGDTEADSHLELPVVRRARADLERIELVPFRAAIAAGAPLLMTAHVLYPALDAAHPATLSRKILRDLLRTELHFDGVIASDDLEMRAITAHQAIGEAAVATLAAGADMLLVCADLAHAGLAQNAIERAVRDGALDPDAVPASCARMERVRASHAGSRPLDCDLPNAQHRSLLEAIRAADARTAQSTDGGPPVSEDGSVEGGS